MGGRAPGGAVFEVAQLSLRDSVYLHGCALDAPLRLSQLLCSPPRFCLRMLHLATAHATRKQEFGTFRGNISHQISIFRVTLCPDLPIRTTCPFGTSWYVCVIRVACALTYCDHHDFNATIHLYSVRAFSMHLITGTDPFRIGTKPTLNPPMNKPKGILGFANFCLLHATFATLNVLLRTK